MRAWASSSSMVPQNAVGPSAASRRHETMSDDGQCSMSEFRHKSSSKDHSWARTVRKKTSSSEPRRPSGWTQANIDPDPEDSEKRLEARTGGLRCGRWCNGDPKTRTGQRNEMIKILAIILIPVCILIGLTGNSFGVTVNNYLYSTSARSTLLFSLDLAHMIRFLQRERDGSALYLSSIGPETKEFLLERYQDSDKAIQALPAWPSSLNNSRPEFESSEAFLKTLNRHRYELDSTRDTFHDELIIYSDWIDIFITWFYKSITEARSTKVWKEFVAYQELLIASEYLGRERAIGVIFYTLGKFPTREEYLYFAESQDTSNSSFAAARQYSTIAKTIYDGTIKDNPELMNTIRMKRAEIRGRNSGKISNINGSLEQAKFWFENMTYFQDIIKKAQVELANTIDGMLATQQEKDLTNIVIICIIFSVVLILCPVIVYAVYNLTARIQRCSVLIASRSQSLHTERARTDILLHQMVPIPVARRLKLNDDVATEAFAQATVMLSNIVGFSKLASRSSPSQIVRILNEIYSCHGELIARRDVFKAETIGDAQLFVSGVPLPNGKQHASEIANLALDILQHVNTMDIPHIPEAKIQFRIGCHSGPVVAGLVGTTMPHYTVFGETVQVAMRLEALGQANKIHLSESTANILMTTGGYVLRKREHFQEPGQLKTYWLLGRKGGISEDPGASDTDNEDPDTNNASDADVMSCNSSVTGHVSANGMEGSDSPEPHEDQQDCGVIELLHNQ